MRHQSFSLRPQNLKLRPQRVEFCQQTCISRRQNLKMRFQLTKIVATVGPTSEQLEPLQKVVKAGIKIMRLNFSHATTDEVELRLKNLALSQVSEG